MAVNYYLMPRIGTGDRADPFRGKYWSGLPSPKWQMDLGLELTFVVAADNVPAGTHSTIAGDSTCVVIPAIATTIPNNATRNNVRSSLEAMNIPAGWVNTGMTYQTVLKFTMLFCQIMQRWVGLGGSRMLTGGVTLDTTYGSLPAAAQQRLADVATSFGWSTSGLTAGSTLRTILKNFADQWATTLTFGGVAW